MIIDFHSHILPEIDDGAANLNESLELIKMSASQGVGLMAATPHFYAYSDTLEAFLNRRSAAWEKLRPELPADAPKILLGAEVCYFGGIGRVGDILRLSIGGSGLLLLEMPFAKWTPRVIDDVLDLQNNVGAAVALAHIERYISMQKGDTVRALLNSGILIQSNAEFFTGRRTRKTALKMFERGEIHFLGSDCHNTASRPPRLGEAVQVITSAFGESAVNQFFKNCSDILESFSLN